MGSSTIAYYACQRLMRGVFSKQHVQSSSSVAPLLVKKFNLDTQSLFRRKYSTEKDDEEIEEEGKLNDLNDWMEKRAEDSKDRSREIPLEVSMAYMDSAAYKTTYGDSKIWELYRRNFAKGKTFKDTRRTCIRQHKIATGSPCPICRDEYLVVDYRNMKLITQFLNEYNGEVLSTLKTGVCQLQNRKLLIEIERARDRGLLKVDPPFIEYDYSLYKPRDLE